MNSVLKTYFCAIFQAFSKSMLLLFCVLVPYELVELVDVESVLVNVEAEL